MLDTGYAIRLTVDIIAWKVTVWWTGLQGALTRNLRTCDRRIVLSSFKYDNLDTLGLQTRRLRPTNYSNLCTVFRRLAEAHLVALQMLVALAVSGLFQAIWP